MQSDCQKFKYGQIWLWEDPIFGPKKLGRVVPEHEIATRYSRYVLIVQPTHDISDTGNLLVVPMTTSQLGKSMYRIPIRIFNDTVSVMLLDKIFSVHHETLMRYVSTVSNSIMNQVSSLIHMMLFGNQFNQAEPELILPPSIQLASPPEVSPPLYAMPSERSNPKKEDRRGKYIFMKWTPERKVEFIRACQGGDLEAVAERFDIKVNSVKKYLRTFKREFPQDSDISEVKPPKSAPAPEPKAPAKEKASDPIRDFRQLRKKKDAVMRSLADQLVSVDLKLLCDTCSAMTDVFIRYTKRYGWYEILKKGTFLSGSDTNEREFYNHLSNSFYWSLRQILDINMMDESIDSTISPEGRNIKYFHLMNKYISEVDLYTINEFNVLIDTYREKYNISDMVDIIPVFSRNVRKKISVTDNGISVLCDLLRKILA